MAFSDTFLIDPSNVYTPLSGDHWGTRRRVIDFAGSSYCFFGLNQKQDNSIQARFAWYCKCRQDCKKAKVVSNVVQVSPALFKDIDFTGKEYTFELDYDDCAVRLAGHNFMAHIDLHPRVQGTLWISAHLKDDFLLIFENFFRTLASYQVLSAGGVVLHSACIAKENRAYLAIGHSGAGKTTFSRMAEAKGWEVLSDDMNAVTFDGKQWLVEKLPFSGDLGQRLTRQNRYPLAGICMLRQSTDNYLSEWSYGAAVAKMLGCSPVVNSDPVRLDPLMTILESILNVTPRGILKFCKNGNAPALLKKLKQNYARIN